MNVIDDGVDWNPILLERVAVTEGDGAILGGVTVDGDAKRSANFILPSVTAADGSLLVVD